MNIKTIMILLVFLCASTAFAVDNAEITAFTVPTGLLTRGQQAQTTVTVQNTGDTTRSFWIGLSFAHETAVGSGWPEGFYDIYPIQTGLISPGAQEAIVFDIVLHESLRGGQYYAVTQIWDNFNTTTYLMENSFDSSLLHPEMPAWQENPDLGMVSFSLPSLSSVPSNFVAQINSWIQLVDEVSVDEAYISGLKPLLSLSTSVNIINTPLGIPALDAGGAVFIDLADLCQVTAEGNDEWVTVWVTGNLGVVNLSSTSFEGGFGGGVISHEFDGSQTGTADYRPETMDFLNFSTPFFSFSGISFIRDGGINWGSFSWGGTSGCSFSLQNANFDLYKFEMNRDILLPILSTVGTMPDANYLSPQEYSDQVLEIILGQPDSVFRTFTVDDGDTSLVMGAWESNLSMDVKGSYSYNANYFVIDVPADTELLKVIAQNGIGDGSIHTRLNSRPDFFYHAGEYTYSSAIPGSITIPSPPAGKYYISMATTSSYEGVDLVATTETGGVDPVEPTEVSGTISSDTTWTLSNSPYHIVGDVTVASGATLTIEAGVIVKFNAVDTTSASEYRDRNDLVVNGTLNILGTSGSEVVFTSSRDDVYGGDSNGDGSSSGPGAGNWGNVKINNDSSVIHHAIFRYGGLRRSYDNHTFYDKYMLWINDCSPTISNCTFEYAYERAVYYYAEQSYASSPVISNNVFRSSLYGLYFDGGSTVVDSSPKIEENYVWYNTTAGIYLYRASGGTVLNYNTIRNNSYGIRCNSAYVNINENNIYDNTTSGVHNDTSSITVNAKRNWWGDVSGPTHASNPGGTGDVVSDYADFSSWQTESVSSGGTGVPVISSIPLTYGIVGYRYNYDDDNITQATGTRPITWSVVYGPAGFQIDSSTGLITWYPDEPSSHSVVLMAENNVGSDIQAFTVYVSLDDGGGPGETQETQVPGLTGLTLSAAQEAISAAILSQGSISYVNSDTVPVNCVIRQTPAANTVVNENYPVTLLVSSGIKGNLNDNDNAINMADFAKLANYWGEPAVLFPAGDFDTDGVIGIGDLLFICDGWLTSGPVKLYEVIDGNPGWTMTGQWQFGTPLGLGGVEYGNSDPESGYTGDNVYGVNIFGDYSTTPGGPYYLTAGPFDCTEYSNITLRFARWLNIDESFYADAAIEISNNGSDWYSIWMYDETGPITDSDWQKMEYDISPHAANQGAIYIRWSYEIFDWAYPYSGWNIDDIEIIGIR